MKGLKREGEGVGQALSSRSGGRGANYCPRPNLAHTCFCIVRKLRMGSHFFNG